MSNWSRRFCCSAVIKRSKGFKKNAGEGGHKDDNYQEAARSLICVKIKVVGVLEQGLHILPLVDEERRCDVPWVS